MKHEPCVWREGRLFGEKRGRTSKGGEKENAVIKKKEEKLMKEIPPHPVRWGRWVSKLPSPTVPSSSFCAQTVAADSRFSWASTQINCQGKSVSNMGVSWECRKQPYTQSKLVWNNLWSCSPPCFCPRTCCTTLINVSTRRETTQKAVIMLEDG